MIFFIRKTSHICWEEGCKEQDECRPHEKAFFDEKGWRIKVSSLEELLELCRRERVPGEIVVGVRTSELDADQSHYIEIYDGFRE